MNAPSNDAEPAMRLHWSPLSPYVRTVMLTAHELGLVDQIETVRTRVYAMAPNLDLVPDNPLVKIPTLVLSDGRRLQDSRVICEYLDHRRAPDRMSLYPEEAGARLDALRRQALGAGLLDLLILWRQEGDREPHQQSESLVAVARGKVALALAALDEQVYGWTGRPFDIGDVYIGCVAAYFDYRFPAETWRPTHPRLSGWLDRFLTRASAVATTPVNDKTPPPPFKG